MKTEKVKGMKEIMWFNRIKKTMVTSIILMLLFSLSNTPISAQANQLSVVYRQSADPTYNFDLRGEIATELVLAFNGTETLYMDDTNYTHYINFWGNYVPSFTTFLNDTLSNILDTHSGELNESNITSVVVVWGYPDNFNTTIVTENGDEIVLYNYFEDVTLPQPEGFYILKVIYANSFGGDNDTFLHFTATISDPTGLDIPTDHEIEKGDSLIICSGKILIYMSTPVAIVGIIAVAVIVLYCIYKSYEASIQTKRAAIKIGPTLKNNHLKESDTRLDKNNVGPLIITCRERTFEEYIPEFTTIAIPVAAILGLIFLMSRRNRSRYSRKNN